MQLREYQKRSLEALEEYLKRCTDHGAKTAFVLQTERPYKSVPQLPELPYVCLRVPTGGGKTLMACHALGIVAREYLHSGRAVCLWLVPSNAIREQTLAALRDRKHPYRRALEEHFNGQVTILDLTEALYVQRGTLAGETTVIVATLQPKRDVLLNLACFIEDTLLGEYDCREVKLLRRDADRVTARIRYHIDGLRISLNVEAEKRKYGA